MKIDLQETPVNETFTPMVWRVCQKTYSHRKETCKRDVFKYENRPARNPCKRNFHTYGMKSMSKNLFTQKRDLQKRLTWNHSLRDLFKNEKRPVKCRWRMPKETCLNRKRPAKETCKRDLQKRLIWNHSLPAYQVQPMRPQMSLCFLTSPHFFVQFSWFVCTFFLFSFFFLLLFG